MYDRNSYHLELLTYKDNVLSLLPTKDRLVPSTARCLKAMCKQM